MRVFETRVFNLKTVPFQKTKVFLDECLHTLGLHYANMALCANTMGDTAVSRLTKSYPALLPYVIERGERRDLFGLAVSNDAKAALDVLVTKIPHGVPITDMGVMLDGIDFYGENTSDGVYVVSPATEAIRQSFCGCYSNHIEIHKFPSFATKRNEVRLVTERMVDDRGLLPLPESIVRLCDMLGKAEHFERECLFDEEETACWDERGLALRSQIETHAYDDRFTEFVCGGSAREQINRLPKELQPISGFSPKTVFVKAAKLFGFCFSSFRQGEYQFFKTTPYGHRFEATMVVPPLTSYVFSRVWVSGWNVNMPLEVTPQVTVYDEQTLAAYAEKAFAVANETVERYAERIADDFGQTPLWFWEI